MNVAVAPSASHNLQVSVVGIRADGSEDESLNTMVFATPAME